MKEKEVINAGKGTGRGKKVNVTTRTESKDAESKN